MLSRVYNPELILRILYKLIVFHLVVKYRPVVEPGFHHYFHTVLALGRTVGQIKQIRLLSQHLLQDLV
jgi:hypothetical protein